jgi:adenylate cyclase
MACTRNHRVATEVVSAIEPNLRHAEIKRSLRKPTTSLDAYDFYMARVSGLHGTLGA